MSETDATAETALSALLGETRGISPPADSMFWTLDDVAYHTRLSVKTLRRMLASGRFGPRPVVIGGRGQRFFREEVLAWLRAGCPRRADWEIERQAEQNRPAKGRTKNPIGG